MKKILLFFAGMLMIGVVASSAQVDTTRTKNKSSQTQQDPSTNYTQDMVKIQASEIPDNLRTTLSTSTYTGWESGTIYRTKANDGYLVEMKDGTKTRTYRFDGQGKPIKDKN